MHEKDGVYSFSNNGTPRMVFDVLINARSRTPPRRFRPERKQMYASRVPQCAHERKRIFDKTPPAVFPDLVGPTNNQHAAALRFSRPHINMHDGHRPPPVGVRGVARRTI